MKIAKEKNVAEKKVKENKQIKVCQEKSFEQ